MPALIDNPFITLELAQAKKDPAKDAAKVMAALRKAADTAPTAQSATNITPQASLDQVMSRFDVTKIPISRLRQMMRDPMLAFGLFFIKAQIQRARWMIECNDAQVAAFLDNATREIWPSYVAQQMMKLVYGYQASIKRFELTTPDWTYFDPNGSSETELPVWNEGSIEALIWKPFVALPPETVDPLWTPSGEFNGIKYKPVATSATNKEAEFDIYHSLWMTDGKDSVSGSLWGYPRIGHAYRFWWSFWFNWGLADRHFEKDADPPAVVYYPANKPPLLDSTGQEVSRRDIALRIGDSARSNSTIALPSDPVIGEDGTTKNLREWELDFASGGGNFEAFENRFHQLQVMMLRAIFVPEEAFLAKGGTAGYNSTGQLQDAFGASQIVLMNEIDFDFNRYVLPQLIQANFSDRVSVRAKKVTKGFDSQDVDLAKTIIQGVANKDADMLNLNFPALLDAVGLPRLTPIEIKKKEEERAARAPQVPDPIDAKQGTADNQVAGVTNEGLYYNPREVINLGDSRAHDAEAVFMADLVAVGALADPIILSDAGRLRTIWQTQLKFDLAVATNLINDYGLNIDLDETFFERFWRRVTNRAHDTAAHTRRALAGIMRRASTREFERAGLEDFSWDPSNSTAASTYLQERGAELVTGVTETTRENIRTYLADLVKRGTPASHMPDLLRAHFSMFSEWRADRIIRTEVAKAYNMAVLLAAQDAGIKQVQAIDAQLGPDRSDPECIARNGRIFTLAEAFVEQKKEHPNGTLQWRLLRRPVRFKRLPVPEGAPRGPLFEEINGEIIVTLAETATEREQNDIALAVVESLDKPAEPETAEITVGDKVREYYPWTDDQSSLRRGTVRSLGVDDDGDFFEVEWEDGSTHQTTLRRTELRRLDTQSF